MAENDNMSKEPPYLKIYFENMLRFEKLPEKPRLVFMALAEMASYADDEAGAMQIHLNMDIKKKIRARLELESIKTVNDAIYVLTKAEILVRAGRGIYRLNPYYFGKGRWEDIERARNITPTTATEIESSNQQRTERGRASDEVAAEQPKEGGQSSREKQAVKLRLYQPVNQQEAKPAKPDEATEIAIMFRKNVRDVRLYDNTITRIRAWIRDYGADNVKWAVEEAARNERNGSDIQSIEYVGKILENWEAWGNLPNIPFNDYLLQKESNVGAWRDEQPAVENAPTYTYTPQSTTGRMSREMGGGEVAGGDLVQEIEEWANEGRDEPKHKITEARAGTSNRRSADEIITPDGYRVIRSTAGDYDY